jgi:hypothetical protein
MAAGMIHRPGDQRGPCEGHCQHKDCASLRKEAETPCTLCGLHVGYESEFYRDCMGSLAHRECVEAENG